ncbi:cytidylyltransferase domain-containing protein [Ensifer soli]|uniref:cytidylyltransferase domain-containing protein n=1 Tax=Ciceribacter sp. sgz301302 TaxID=3342379 RepID=UPI0035B9E43C
MQVATLMIGRGGSSLKNKNVLPVLGVPLLLWGAAAAHRSRYVNSYYCSSDDETILDTAARAGYTPIRRPDALSSATAQSCDAVKHALDIIEQTQGPIDILVLQHANVGTISETMIDDCIEMLIADPSVSSVVPSHDKSEYHPMRAKRVMPDGSLQSFFGEGKVSANRQDLPQAVFFDHSFWVLRGRQAVFDENGQGPWTCMGSRILPYMTTGCLDVHDLEDLDRTAAWITEHGIPHPSF